METENSVNNESFYYSLPKFKNLQNDYELGYEEGKKSIKVKNENIKYTIYIEALHDIFDAVGIEGTEIDDLKNYLITQQREKREVLSDIKLNYANNKLSNQFKSEYYKAGLDDGIMVGEQRTEKQLTTKELNNIDKAIEKNVKELEKTYE